MHSRCIGNDGKPVFASIMCRGRQKLYSEINDHPFAVAVQWHPEMMYDSSEQLKLLRAFVRHHEYLYIWSVQCRTEKDLL